MSSVHAAIAKRFCAPEYATFFEVGDATGGRHSRWADAVSMGIWPSRGLDLSGFEVKVSRSDWLREKADPTKSAPVQRFMDRWWVAVSDEKIVQDGELPPTWGLMVLQGGKLVTKVKAPDLTPEPVTRPFLAALLRRSTENTVPKSALDAMVAERSKEIETRVSERRDREVKQLRSERDTLLQTVAAFEKASGVSIRSWEGTTAIGEAVAHVLRNSRHIATNIERLITAERDVLAAAERALIELRALPHKGDDK